VCLIFDGVQEWISKDCCMKKRKRKENRRAHSQDSKRKDTEQEILNLFPKNVVRCDIL
jgi:hypothetical protein